jgi:acetoacetate decarboxylase
MFGDGGVRPFADLALGWRRRAMGFLKTHKEIQAIESRIRNPQFFDAKVLQVQYETYPEVVRSLLPPPLAPVESPTIFVRIGTYNSNCVGQFSGAGVYISAQLEGTVGVYVIGMYMDTDAAVIFGRETFGEPKKLADVRFSHTPQGVSGAITRHGVELIRVDAEVESDLGGGLRNSTAYNIKCWPSADGFGLQGDALLTATKFETTLRTNQACKGSLELGSTIHDPLSDLPITELIQVNYFEGDHSTSSRVVASIPADTFLPYAYGRNDDWSATFPAPTSTAI